MSYGKRFSKNTDSLSQLVSTICDCQVACRNMLKYKDDPMGFVRWFDKAKLIDGRTTYLFLKEHYGELNQQCQFLCKNFIAKGDAMKKKLNERVERHIREAKYGS